MLLEPLDQHAADLVLLQHQPERVGGVVRQDTEIEIRHHAGSAVAILIVAHHIASRQHGIGHPDRGKQLQRGRVDGAGARIVGDPIPGLQDGDRNAPAHEIERGGQADRAGPRDQDGTRGWRSLG
jgi:hypothetical protein